MFLFSIKFTSFPRSHGAHLRHHQRGPRALAGGVCHASQLAGHNEEEVLRHHLHREQRCRGGPHGADTQGDALQDRGGVHLQQPHEEG